MSSSARGGRETTRNGCLAATKPSRSVDRERRDARGRSRENEGGVRCVRVGY